MSAATCSACGEAFGGVRAFDMHHLPLARDGRHGGCLPPSDCGIRKDRRGVWARPTPERLREADPVTAAGGGPT